MFQVTSYSVISSILWMSIFSVLYYFLRKFTIVALNYGVKSLLFCIACILTRSMTYIEHPMAVVLKSKSIYTVAGSLMSVEIPGVGTVEIVWILSGVWFIGTVIYGLVFLHRHIKLTKAIRSIVPINESIMNVLYPVSEGVREKIKKTGAKIVVSQDVTCPMVYGFIRPTILLPNARVNTTIADYAICHELQHFENLDHWAKLLTDIIVIINWWNPCMRLLRWELDQTLELKCDLKLVGHKDKVERDKYVDTLMFFIGHQNRAYSPQKESAAGISHLVSFLKSYNQDNMLQRFAVIIKYRNKNKSYVDKFIIVGMVVLMAVSYMFIIQPHYEPPSSDELERRTDAINFFKNRIEEDGITYFVDNDGRKYEIGRP